MGILGRRRDLSARNWIVAQCFTVVRIVEVLLFGQFIKQLHDINYLTQPISHACGHCGSDAERLVDSHKIVVHEVKRNGRNVIFWLLRERVRKARKPAHVLAHCEILAFYVARRNVLAGGSALGCAVPVFA